MRRALATLTVIAALGGCGSPPTEQEQNLEQRAPDVGSEAAANTALTDPTEGNREGIAGATQGPTAGESDAPYAGEGSNSGD